jgi:hypothetical protein
MDEELVISQLVYISDDDRVLDGYQVGYTRNKGRVYTYMPSRRVIANVKLPRCRSFWTACGRLAEGEG